MIEGEDYYFLSHERMFEGRWHVHYTSIHHKTSVDGQASSAEWYAQGYDGEVPYDDVKRLARERMLENVIRHYEKKART